MPVARSPNYDYTDCWGTSVGEPHGIETAMATTTPTVRGEVLTWPATETDQIILVGTPAWFAWLEGADSFAYEDSGGRFTARKEPRQRGGWYWKAYRKLAGKLH